VDKKYFKGTKRVTKKIPVTKSSSPEHLLGILGIPVLGSIGNDDEALGFRWKKKATPNSEATSSDSSGGNQSSGNMEQKK
jgi:hypothetical protein